MKTKRNKKPTNKDLQAMMQDLMYRLTAIQSQTNALTEIFSDFLDFTHQKPKFMDYLKNKSEKNAEGSVANPEVKQKELEPA